MDSSIRRSSITIQPSNTPHLPPIHGHDAKVKLVCLNGPDDRCRRHVDTSRERVPLVLVNERYILHVLFEGHPGLMRKVSEPRIPIDNVCKSILNDSLVVEAHSVRLLAVID